MYKQIQTFILCFFFISTSALFTEEISYANANAASDFLCELNKEGDGVIIYGYRGNNTQVIIPAEIEGVPVIQVESFRNPLQTTTYEWEERKSVIEVMVFPDSVTVLGGIKNDFFFQPDALVTVRLPSNLDTIPAAIFAGCKNLQSVVFPKKLKKIEGEAFAGCASLTNIELPNSLKIIGAGAFYGCTGITKVQLPGKVKIIENQAFERCTSLISLSIPYSIDKIGKAAFRDCKSLSHIEVPELKISYGGYGYDSAFSDCISLNAEYRKMLRNTGYSGRFDEHDTGSSHYYEY